MTGEVDIGHGVLFAWMDSDDGIYWKHPGCRAWCFLYFKPHPQSTGHVLEQRSPLTIGGSLLCPMGCGAHGHIRDGRWVQ